MQCNVRWRYFYPIFTALIVIVYWFIFLFILEGAGLGCGGIEAKSAVVSRGDAGVVQVWIGGEKQNSGFYVLFRSVQ